jgi:hypothetical protein
MIIPLADTGHDADKFGVGLAKGKSKGVGSRELKHRMKNGHSRTLKAVKCIEWLLDRPRSIVPTLPDVTQRPISFPSLCCCHPLNQRPICPHDLLTSRF